MVMTRRVSLLEKTAGIVISALTLLLPLKYGTLAVMPESSGHYPLAVWEWLLITWPAQSFGIVSGAVLLLALAAFPPFRFRSFSALVALFWSFGWLIAALPGWFGCAEIEVAQTQTLHLAGIGAYVLAVWLMLERHPEWRNQLAGVMAAGVLLAGIVAWRQYLWGFDEMREFVARQEAEGIIQGGAIRAKLVSETRVSAPFTSSNVLAGYLVMLLPLTMLVLRCWSERFEPVKLSMWLFWLFGAVLAGGAFILARSRGALLAALAAACGWGVTSLRRKWWRIAALAAFLLLVGGGALAAGILGRGFGSMAERADYLRSCALMTAEKPLAGHGWGEFFYRHMQLKQSSTDESARDPHNIVATFAVHCGIPAGMLAVVIGVVPLVGLWRRRRDGLSEAALWGGVAFLFHSLMEINLQVPGIMASAGALFLIGLAAPVEHEPAPSPRAGRLVAAAFVLMMAVGSLWGSWRWVQGEVAFARFYDLLMPGSAEEASRVTPAAIERAYRRVTAYRPGLAAARELAGDYEMARGDLVAAEARYQEARRINPRRPAVYRRMAMLEVRRGNREAAREYIGKAHELFPRNPAYEPENFFVEAGGQLFPAPRSSVGAGWPSDSVRQGKMVW